MATHRKPSLFVRQLPKVALTLVAAGVAAVAGPVALASADPAPPPAFNFTPVIACESGGNPTVVNATGHSGLLQFSTATWRHYGGGEFAPTAGQATPAQQLIVADRAYAANGLGDWKASQGCWAGKLGATVAVTVSVAPARPPRPLTPVVALPVASVVRVAPPTRVTAPVVRVAPVRKSTPAVLRLTAEVTVTAPTGRHASGRTPTAPARATAPRHAAAVVTVVAGDTLSGIAVRARLDWHRLYAANRAEVGNNPDQIFPGETLRLVG